MQLGTCTAVPLLAAPTAADAASVQQPAGPRAVPAVASLLCVPTHSLHTSWNWPCVSPTTVTVASGSVRLSCGRVGGQASAGRPVWRRAHLAAAWEVSRRRPCPPAATCCSPATAATPLPANPALAPHLDQRGLRLEQRLSPLQYRPRRPLREHGLEARHALPRGCVQPALQLRHPLRRDHRRDLDGRPRLAGVGGLRHCRGAGGTTKQQQGGCVEDWTGSGLKPNAAEAGGCCPSRIPHRSIALVSVY